jgi:hypothetical protein
VVRAGWEAFTAARLALGPNLSRDHPADRDRPVERAGAGAVRTEAPLRRSEDIHVQPLALESPEREERFCQTAEKDAA